jgi:putative membrane protein
MNWIINIIIRALILLITSSIIPGFRINSYMTALIVALVLGILNTFLKPVLLFFTFPLNILSLGLFTFIINAILLILSSKLVEGFKIDSFMTAILASIVISIMSVILNRLI